VVCRQLSSTFARVGGITKIETERAKNQLRSSLLMNLESRMVELEDLGRQVQVHGRKIGPMEMSEQIEKLTVDDLRRVAERVLTGQVENEGLGSGKPTIVVQGEGDVGDVAKIVNKYGLGRRESKWKL